MVASVATGKDGSPDGSSEAPGQEGQVRENGQGHEAALAAAVDREEAREEVLMAPETIDTGPYEVTREEPREYRKTALVKAGAALAGGIIRTPEGDHAFEAGDYICGPGAAGEFWPVKREIFEATYVPASPTLKPGDERHPAEQVRAAGR
jgi:hypothetical protein